MVGKKELKWAPCRGLCNLHGCRLTPWAWALSSHVPYLFSLCNNPDLGTWLSYPKRISSHISEQGGFYWQYSGEVWGGDEGCILSAYIHTHTHTRACTRVHTHTPLQQLLPPQDFFPPKSLLGCVLRVSFGALFPTPASNGVLLPLPLGNFKLFTC